MRTLIYLLTALAVMALAFWAYRENYRTQEAITRMQAVQTEMAGLREKIGLLRAEWAFLNRPERLAKLVTLNADKLRLQPLKPGQFVAPKQVPFPLPGRQPADDAALPGDDGWSGPSQNPGAPPRRPAVSANPMAGATDPAADAPADPTLAPTKDPESQP